MNLLQVQFRNSVNRTTMSHYWNNGRAVAFARSGQGFFAMAKDGFMDENLQTGYSYLIIIKMRNFSKSMLICMQDYQKEVIVILLTIALPPSKWLRTV